MKTADNGGPAFPDPGRAQSEKQREKLTDTGMTLRDYFAAQAMQALLGWGADQWIARDAYIVADKMIAERAK